MGAKGGPSASKGNEATDFDLSSLLAHQEVGLFDRIGPYAVSEKLGRGAMGIVLKAFDTVLQRTVAIKVLTPQLAACEKFRSRFLKEARAAAAINHPNVVTIHAVGEHRGLPYLVMECISGCTLKQRIQRDTGLEVPEILRIGTQIADGLCAAHRQGVVHRDIKPSNIMLEDTVERVKITDFGLARAAVDRSGQTSLGHIVGTPAYMSPEQVAGGRIDPRSDLYSLGCVFYAMATGSSPFAGSHTMEILQKVNQFTPPPLDELDASIPAALSQMVARLLQKNPDDRYQSAAEVAGELTSLLATCYQAPSASTVRATSPGRARPAGRDESKKAPRGWWINSALAVAVAASAALAFAPLWMPAPSPGVSQPSDKTGSSAGAGNTPPSARVITVSKSGQSQCRTLNEALQLAGPATEIRVLDSATYDESVEIDDPGRWRGVKIISQNRATVTASGERSVFVISGTPGVVIDGLEIQTGEDQHGVVIRGPAEAVVIRNLRVTAPVEGKWALVHLPQGTHGSARDPIEIRDCALDAAGFGIILEGDSEAPISFVRIINNMFFEKTSGTKIQLLQAVRNIEVTGNVFVGGKGLSCMLPDPLASNDVLIANNSFLNTRYWLNLANSSPGPGQARISNNLILGGGNIETSAVPLSQFARHWTFSDNFWEATDGETDLSDVQLVAERRDRVELLSRDPAHPDFLLPPAGSPLGSGGTGGDLPEYIGAFAPATQDNRDNTRAP